MTTQAQFDAMFKHLDLKLLALEHIVNPDWPQLRPAHTLYIQPVQNCIKILGILYSWQWDGSTSDDPNLSIYNKSYTFQTIYECLDLSEYTLKKYLKVLVQYGLIHTNGHPNFDGLKGNDIRYHVPFCL